MTALLSACAVPSEILTHHNHAELTEDRAQLLWTLQSSIIKISVILLYIPNPQPSLTHACISFHMLCAQHL